MIHTIVYANRDGYDFFEKTQDFPMEYQNQIGKICSRISDGLERTANEHAYRYAPLKDKFLLSVVRRYPNGNNDQSRAHKIVVNFLLDTDDADWLWKHPVSQCIEAAVMAASDILKNYREKIIDDNILKKHMAGTQASVDVAHSCEKAEILLGGLLSSGDGEVQKQLFIQTVDKPVQLLNSALEKLPCAIRKYVRFMTNVYSCDETHDISLCFHIQPLSNDTASSPATDKTLISFNNIEKIPRIQHELGKKIMALSNKKLYTFYSRCIHHWKDFLLLLEASNTDNFDKKAIDILGMKLIIFEITPSLSISDLYALYSLDFNNPEILKAVKTAAEQKLEYGVSIDKLSSDDLKAYKAILPEHIKLNTNQKPSNYDETVKIDDKHSSDEETHTIEYKDVKKNKRFKINPETKGMLLRLVYLLIAVAFLISTISKCVNVSGNQQVITIRIVAASSIAVLLTGCILSFLIGYYLRDVLIRCSRIRKKADKNTK